MSKTEKSIHSLCIAAIKRKTILPYDFKYTRFYERNEDLFVHYLGLLIDLNLQELIICSTIGDSGNFSILTTQRIITEEDRKWNECKIPEIINTSFGNFKGGGQQKFTTGAVKLINDTKMNYFIETGVASMIMVYGIQTISNLTK